MEALRHMVKVVQVVPAAVPVATVQMEEKAKELQLVHLGNQTEFYMPAVVAVECVAIPLMAAKEAAMVPMAKTVVSTIRLTRQVQVVPVAVVLVAMKDKQEKMPQLIVAVAAVAAVT